MQNQSEATLPDRSSPKPFRMTARIVGVLLFRFKLSDRPVVRA